jgi:Mycobacterium membrane protein
MPLLAAVVVAVAGFAVYRLNGTFGSHDVTSTPKGAAYDIVPFIPKHVVMEVFGAPGSVANITYLDVNAQPQRVAAALPWAYDTTTTQPAIFVSAVRIQSDTDSIDCRIKIDDVVKADGRSVVQLLREPGLISLAVSVDEGCMRDPPSGPSITARQALRVLPSPISQLVIHAG